MTIAQLKDRIAHVLEDEGLTHFTDDDLSDSINDGYMLISVLTEALEDVEQITLPAASMYYDLSSSISDLYRVFAIYNETTKRWLSPRTLAYQREKSARWETIRGNVLDFTPLGANYILFHPSPTQSQTLYCFVKKVAPDLTSGDSPQFYSDCHIALQHYVAQDLLDQNLEYTKSSAHFELFKKELAALNKRLNSRPIFARIMELSCLSIAKPISIR